METLIYALLVAFFAGFLPSFNLPTMRGFFYSLIFGVATFLVAGFFNYFILDHMVGPFLGLTGAILIYGFISALVSLLIFSEHSKSLPIGAAIYCLYILIAIIVSIYGSQMLNKEKFFAMLGEVEERTWTKDIHPMDETHVRVVPEAYAAYRGALAIGSEPGSLGSRYEPGNYHLQKVNGEQFWVAVLEFINFKRWSTYKTSPGYIMVSAEDPNRKVEFRTGYKLKYIPSACFGSHLQRYLYNKGYGMKGLTEYSFEIDDEYNPYYVITLYEPTSTYFCPKVTGVVVVDPQTGDITEYLPEDAPEWIDRIQPEDFTEEYISWWGEYKHSWFNSWWGKRDVELPTSYNDDNSGVVLTFGVGGSQDWFTGLTSASTADDALNGFMMVDSRTGKARVYRGVGGATENAAKILVNGLVSNFAEYVPFDPIPRNVGGQLTYIIPVLHMQPSQEGGTSKATLQRVAFVNMETTQLNSLASTLKEAHVLYKRSLMRKGFDQGFTSTSNEETVFNVPISRIVLVNEGGNTSARVYFSEIPNKLFIGDESVSLEIFPSLLGDFVDLRYINSGEGREYLTFFDNKSLNIETSEPQKIIEQRRDSTHQKVQIRKEAKEAENLWKDLSDEEKAKIFQEIKK